MGYPVTSVTECPLEFGSAPLCADLFIAANSGVLVKSGRLYARISSRPGQSGRCDGCVRLTCLQQSCVSLTARCRYILEGRELEFYVKKMQKKKGKQ